MSPFARFHWLSGFLIACACGRTGLEASPSPPHDDSDCGARSTSSAAATGVQSAEDAWLSRIGSGAPQTARVCARGARDRIATVLCNPATPAIRSLYDLYRVLDLDAQKRATAVTTHSLGLSARAVSEANPRVLTFIDSVKATPISLEQIAAVAFSRGEQAVELVGFDPSSMDYNFYLLTFRQCCNLTRCTPADLLTENVEKDWVDWTLYVDRDLEDTPLNCRSCHQPYGGDSRKMLLMRQVLDPWMHWSDFRGGTERSICPEPPSSDGPGRTIATVDPLELLRAIEGPGGRYAGIPMSELEATPSGKRLTDFMVDANNTVRAHPGRDQADEQLYFQTREVLCERFYTGVSPTFEENRRRSFAHGQPVPYYGPDVLDREARRKLIYDWTGTLRATAEREPFELAASFLAADVPPATGFTPRAEDSGETILQAACFRCHRANVDPSLRRARFNAEAVSIEPGTFREVQRRLRLPASSAERMPPARFTLLPNWARERLETFLRERCSEPGRCQ
jgi:hypothetical protein